MDVKGQQRESSLEADCYFSSAYFEKKQILSQIHQFELIKKHGVKNILEIGPGNGLTSFLIKSSGYDLTTFDINENLKPDVLGDITKINSYFDNSEFDTILCCEVLEHLPFIEFEHIIEKLSHLSTRTIILSLPQNKKNFLDIDFSFRFLHSRSFNFNIFRRFGNNKLPDQHFWEVDSSKSTSAKQLEAILSKHTHILKKESYYANRYHIFYVLTPK
ncbi:class I SAM-dependent methyltransferase [Membranicola marinus]|uniref:Class I SAM-dependent methyltransferase n=1 Tax=Membranihabitans marinus TaxID=1227546 RepID=A0A953HQI0_9BACT|nr:methyltransferase domain-containing protein [Membranihabitans marinus]MBY5959917.1 class I SAM-dependent methyltransferase [Membranihabitans marinus]